MITYKVKLMFDGPEIYDHWVKQLYLVKECYNFSSRIVFNEKLQLNLKAFHARLYKSERDEFPELPAQMCIKVYKQVLANYRTVDANKHRIDKPLEMKNPVVQLDKKLYSGLTRNSFKLSNGDKNRRSVVKFMTYPKFDELTDRYRMCDPLIKYDEKSREFYACIPFLALSTTPHEDSYLGVDLGMKRLATLSDGTAYTDKEYLGTRRKVRYNKWQLQKHKKHSHSARRKLAKLRRKERNISKNMCHHLSNEILRHEGSVIVVEDLTGIKNTTSRTSDGFKRKRHNNAISQVPFFQLKEILTYKALLHGKRVETVSPEYTSREDCRTQSAEGCERKGCRFYTADGRLFDADWNAALNICNRYKRSSSFKLPIDGRLNLVDRLCQRADRGSGSPTRKLPSFSSAAVDYAP